MRRTVHITIMSCLLALAVFISLPVQEALVATLTATKTPLLTNTLTLTATSKLTGAGESVDFALKVDFTVGTGPTGVVLGDLDGDGKLDLAASNYGLADGSTVSVLRNTGTTGNMSFAAKVDYTVETGPHGIAIGDLDGDGKLDLVTANYAYSGGGTTVSVLRNTSTIGNLSFAPKVDLTTGDGP